MNFSKNRNLYKYGLTPLVKSSGRPKWQRLPKNHVFYYRSPVHQNHYVLSFAFAFEKEDEVYQFAVAPPYSFSRLQAYLGALENKFRDTFARETIGKSLVSCDTYDLYFQSIYRSVGLLLYCSKIANSNCSQSTECPNHHASIRKISFVSLLYWLDRIQVNRSHRSYVKACWSFYWARTPSRWFCVRVSYLKLCRL